MKKHKNYCKWAAAALLLAATSACTNDEITDFTPTPPESPTQVTVTAHTGGNAQTRLTYTEEEDGGTTATRVGWSAGKNEKFSLFYASAADESYLFVKNEMEETTTATFTTTAQMPATVPNEPLYAVYPGNETLMADATSITVDFASQDGNATGKHLMVAQIDGNKLDAWNDADFTFQTKVALLKLTVKHEDFTVGKIIPNILIRANGLYNKGVYTFRGDGVGWQADSDASNSISAGRVTVTNAGEATAYIALPPASLGELAITVTCEGKNYTGSLPAKTLSENKVYTATVDNLIKGQQSSMQFTIRTTTENEAFMLPFVQTTTGDYTLTVDWGDGEIPTTIPSGAYSDDLTSLHFYTNTGTYTITLSSTAATGNEQMPGWSYKDISAATLLISMDTPML